MNARKVKARVFRVIDGDPWKDLESQISALESTTFISGDTSDVTATSDTDAKQKYLDEAAERIRKAVDRASALGTKEKQIAQDQAVRAIEKARDLQRSIIAPGVAVATSTATKLRQVEEAAEDLVPWYLAIGAATWLLIGVGVLVAYRSAKSGRTTRRTNQYRKSFARGARQAGVL